MIQFDNCVKRYNTIILKDMQDAGIKTWIAGGSVRDYFMGVPIKTDNDMFFPDEDNFNKARAWFTNAKAELKWESDNGCKYKLEGRVFDLVKKYFPDPQSTINEFDFTVSQFAVDSTKVYHGETSFIDLSKRQLMINKITYPASTMSRAFRYYKKGFSMCMEEMEKLVISIQDMPKPEPTDDDPDLPPSGNRNIWIGID